MKNFKLTVAVLLGAVASMLFFVAATPTTSTGGEFNGLKNTCKEYHITAKETNTLASQNLRLYSLVYNVSNAGTAWTITVQDKQGTPSLLLSAVALATNSGNPTIVAIPPPGILMTGGVDIITGGTTAGVMDLWACYR